jgi:hypothetical protein
MGNMSDMGKWLGESHFLYPSQLKMGKVDKWLGEST